MVRLGWIPDEGAMTILVPTVLRGNPYTGFNCHLAPGKVLHSHAGAWERDKPANRWMTSCVYCIKKWPMMGTNKATINKRCRLGRAERSPTNLNRWASLHSAQPTQERRSKPTVGATPRREFAGLAIATRRRSYGVRKQSGFTLLEMLLVIFLMALVASTGLMLTDGVEDQAKYDETKRRMELIRKAIVGDPTRTVNGAPEISGFVADMGRLPGCLRELLDAVDCGNPATALPLWTQDANTGTGAGWRGPYLSNLPDHDGVHRFRDGYGNVDIDEDGAGTADVDDDALNFGWVWQLYKADRISPTTDPAEAILIRIKSKGYDGQEGNGDDFPQSSIDDTEPLVDEADYRVSFQNWNDITVAFQNASGVARTIPNDAVRLALSFADSSETNGLSVSLSPAFPSSAMSIPSLKHIGSLTVSPSTSITVPAGTTLSDNTLKITTAGNVIISDDVSIPVQVGYEITIPPDSELAGNTVNIVNPGDITFSDDSQINVTTNFSLPIVHGQFSLAVVCDASRKLFDGDCNDDEDPSGHNPPSQPWVFNALPRGGLVLPPSPLIWRIR